MYQVKIIDGKPWVVEVKLGMEEHLRGCTKFPTLSENLSHWQALEGKELQLGHNFTLEDHGRKSENGKGWASTYSLETTAIPLPQPNEDEVYRKLTEVITNHIEHYNNKVATKGIIDYIKKHYTISKK